MTDIDQWLGGEYGRDGAKPLRPDMVAIFKVGADDGVWDLDDVPEADKEGTLDGPMTALRWCAFRR